MSCFPFESKAIFFWFRVIAPDYSCLVPVEQIVKPGFFCSELLSSLPYVVYGTVFLIALPSSLAFFIPALVLSFGVTVTDEFAFCLVSHCLSQRSLEYPT